MHSFGATVGGLGVAARISAEEVKALRWRLNCWSGTQTRSGSGNQDSVISAAVAKGSLVLLSIGFLVMGAGLAVPYASAPRLALSALSPAQTGQGSGIVNA